VRNLKILSGGSTQKGIGHLSRVASICSGLITNECLLIDSDQYAFEFASEYFSSIKKVRNRDEILASLSPGDVLLADTYEFSAPFWKEIKEMNVKLILVNDIPTPDLEAELLVNHAPGIKESDFLNSKITDWALGLKYSLIRDTFLANAQEEQRNEKEDYCFICMGGADPLNITAWFFNFFRNNIPGIEIKMVVNNESELYSEDPRLALSGPLNEKDIFKMIAKAKMAILPSSTLALEAIACRTPFITGYFIENQIQLYRGLLGMELAYGIGNMNDLETESFVTHFSTFWNDSELLNKITLRHKANLDGHSIERLQSSISQLLIN
jgi:UDP-2,4-diacetamido-2,4,6-trideoxy-beta-L-altropyranose hydrolase